MTIPGGYLFRPSRYSPPIGHAGLDIEVTEKPGRRAGYIRSATFPVVITRPTERVVIDSHHENGAAETFPICAGGFRLRAGNDDVIYGFSFGGTVFAGDQGDHTVCRLESAAPIFDLAYELSSTSVFLYSEFAALLARRRAAWADDVEFGRRLAAAEPLSLFIATLAALAVYLACFRGSFALEEYRRGAAAIHGAIATLSLAGEWPAFPPAPADLL